MKITADCVPVIDAGVVSDNPIVKKKGHVTKEKVDQLPSSQSESGEVEEGNMEKEQREAQVEEEGERKLADVGSPSSDSSLTLRPLAHIRSKHSGKSDRVQRQLPDWITNAHIIENDIEQFSRYGGLV